MYYTTGLAVLSTQAQHNYIVHYVMWQIVSFTSYHINVAHIHGRIKVETER
jgi:hypothetical protein